MGTFRQLVDDVDYGSLENAFVLAADLGTGEQRGHVLHVLLFLEIVRVVTDGAVQKRGTR